MLERVASDTTKRVAWYTPSPAYEPTDTKIHMGGLWDPKNKIRKIGGDSIYSGNRSIGDDIIIMKHNFHLGRRHARPFSVNTLASLSSPLFFLPASGIPFNTPPCAVKLPYIYPTVYIIFFFVLLLLETPFLYHASFIRLRMPAQEEYRAQSLFGLDGEERGGIKEKVA